ncbi:MAG: BACON domain-containing protein [Hallella bergensis]
MALALFLSGCSNEDPTPTGPADEATQQVVNSGLIEFDNQGGKTELRFNMNSGSWTAKVGNDTEESTAWCSTDVQTDGQKTIVTVSAQPNPGISGRKTTVLLSSDTQTHKINVMQKPTPQFEIVNSHVDVPGAGGKVFVTLRTHHSQTGHSQRLPMAHLREHKAPRRQSQGQRRDVSNLSVQCREKYGPRPFGIHLFSA